MTRRRLLLVGIPETHADRAIARAQALGCEVVVGARAASLDAHRRLVAAADRLVAVDDTDEQALEALVIELEREAPLAGIFTFKEDSLVAVASIQTARGMPANPPEVVAACIDKGRTRRRLEQAGLSGPRYARCDGLKEARSFAAAVDGPVVVKPIDRQGSVGVTVADADHDLSAAVAASRRHSRNGEVLIEELLVGREISIEAMIYRGDAVVFGVTDKALFPGTFVESGHVSPSAHAGPPSDWAELVSAVSSALAIRWGPLHIEGFLTSRGFVIGEVHTRYGGDHITTITELARPCDMHSPVLADLLGLPYQLEVGDARGVAGIRFFGPPAGTVRSVEGVERARRLDGIVALDVPCRPGDALPTISSSFDRRAGWVIAAGPTHEDVSNVLCRAVDTVHIHIDQQKGA
jgi:biotin carboxylase